MGVLNEEILYTKFASVFLIKLCVYDTVSSANRVSCDRILNFVCKCVNSSVLVKKKVIMTFYTNNFLWIIESALIGVNGLSWNQT